MAAGIVEMSQAEYARYRGVSRAAIGKAVKAGRIPSSAITAEKKIDVAAADLALGQNQARINSPTAAAAPGDELPLAPTAAVAPGAPAGAVPGLTEARTVEAQISARLKELEFQQRIGKVVFVDDVARSMERCAEALIRDLDQLPARADDLVTAYTRNGVAGVRVLLKDIARDVRTTIANNMRLLAEADDDDAGDADETDKSDDQAAAPIAAVDQHQELAS